MCVKYNTYHTKMTVWTCTKTIKASTHTHRVFTQTSDKKENMSGMKASREECHENMAVSQTFGLKVFLSSFSTQGCLEFPLRLPFSYIPVKTQRGQKVRSWPRAASSPGGGRNCKNTLWTHWQVWMWSWALRKWHFHCETIWDTFYFTKSNQIFCHFQCYIVALTVLNKLWNFLNTNKWINNLLCLKSYIFSLLRFTSVTWRN